MNSIIFKSQILDTITSIEKKYYEITIIENKPIDHMKVSENLLELAEVEENNNNQCLSVFYKFCSEQMHVINTTHNKRIYPENSFTSACDFQLHSNSSRHYEFLRKSVPFILLPDKRTLFDVNKKAAIPADCFSTLK